MGHLLHSLAAACRARNQLFFGLLLKIFKAWKPALELMLFLADKVVNYHTTSQAMNKFVLEGCQGSKALLASGKPQIALAENNPMADLPVFLVV